MFRSGVGFLLGFSLGDEFSEKEIQPEDEILDEFRRVREHW